MNCKGNASKPQSKSLLEACSKQKSTLLLSQKQKSSIMKEEARPSKKNSHKSR